MQFYFARLEGEKMGGGKRERKVISLSFETLLRDSVEKFTEILPTMVSRQQPGSGLEMGVIGRAGSSPSKWPTCNATSIEERRHGANSC